MANTTVMNISKGPHSAKVIRQSSNPFIGYLVKFYTNNKYHGDGGDYETGGYPKEQQEIALQDAIGTAKNTLHRLASHSGHGHHELIIDDKRRGSNLRENFIERSLTQEEHKHVQKIYETLKAHGRNVTINNRSESGDSAFVLIKGVDPSNPNDKIEATYVHVIPNGNDFQHDSHTQNPHRFHFSHYYKSIDGERDFSQGEKGLTHFYTGSADYDTAHKALKAYLRHDSEVKKTAVYENVLLEYKRTYADGMHDSSRLHDAAWKIYWSIGPLVAGGAYLGGELAQNLGLPKLAGQIPGGLAGGVGSFILGDTLSRLTYGKSPSERALIKQNKLPVGSKVTYPDPNLGPVGQNNYGKPVKGTVVKHNKETLKTTVQRERDGKHIIVSSHHLDPA